MSILDFDLYLCAILFFIIEKCLFVFIESNLRIEELILTLTCRLQFSVDQEDRTAQGQEFILPRKALSK